MDKKIVFSTVFLLATVFGLLFLVAHIDSSEAFLGPKDEVVIVNGEKPEGNAFGMRSYGSVDKRHGVWRVKNFTVNNTRELDLDIYASGRVPSAFMVINRNTGRVVDYDGQGNYEPMLYESSNSEYGNNILKDVHNLNRHVKPGRNYTLIGAMGRNGRLELNLEADLVKNDNTEIESVDKQKLIDQEIKSLERQIEKKEFTSWRIDDRSYYESASKDDLDYGSSSLALGVLFMELRLEATELNNTFKESRMKKLDELREKALSKIARHKASIWLSNQKTENMVSEMFRSMDVGIDNHLEGVEVEQDVETLEAYKEPADFQPEVLEYVPVKSDDEVDPAYQKIYKVPIEWSGVIEMDPYNGGETISRKFDGRIGWINVDVAWPPPSKASISGWSVIPNP